MGKVFKGKSGVIIQKIREIDSLYHAAAIKANVSKGELSIWLALLNAKEEYSQQDICDIFSLPRQTVNSLIANLTKKGFVCLKHDPGSRNRKIICLTESGRAFGQDQVSWIFEAEQKAREETDPQELQVCIFMLEKYIQRLQKEIEAREA